MKKILLLIAACIVAQSTLSAKEENLLFSASVVGMMMDYTEYDKNDVFLDSEKSDFNEMIGSEFRLAYQEQYGKKSAAEIGIDLNMIGGQTDYVGYYLISGLPAINKTNNFIYDVAVDYRYSRIYENGFTIHAGLGIGYRSWRRELSADQIEVYTWASVRPQVGFSYSVDKVKLSIFAEYQYGLDTKMAILQNSENPEKSLDLGSADILEINIPVAYSLNESIDLFVNYVYQEQRIGASNYIEYQINSLPYLVHEPKSTADNQYLKFGATLKF